MLSAGTTFLCVSLLCFSSLCILADDDDKREAVREEARQVPKQDVEEEESLEDRSAQIIRAQDAEEGAEKSWRDEDLGDVAEPSGIQEGTQCLSPPPPDNGFIVGSYFREGAKVHVLCEDGYVLAGPSELTCIACTFCSGGIWSPEEKYSCKPRNPSLVEIRPLKEENETHPVYNIQETTLSCPPPKPPEHGYLQGRNYSLDASLHIVCDPGYTLSGQDHITCLRVPAPFKNVVAWQPFDMPRCQIMPPSLLPMGVKVGVSEMKGITSHRLTDTSPGTIPTEGLPHICFLPKVVGPCQLYLPRFYFDPSIEECTSFVYGGCGGNENNFESMDICQHKCR